MRLGSPNHSPEVNKSNARKTNPWGWKRVLVAIVLITTLGLGLLALGFLRSVREITQRIPESYAAWTAGNLIVDFLNTHSNQWPRSWEDLDQVTNCQRYVPIERLREQVKVDWDADFHQLVQAARSNPAMALRVVTRPDGSKLHALWGADTEPNRKIMGYLLWSLSQSNAPPASTTN
ncbi:MAG: hypothetical protein KIS67_01020 [Verrucomicrobiae bacterium]|nr:hypothetical protein [Verrucomicrobiae bacterium]